MLFGNTCSLKGKSYALIGKSCSPTGKESPTSCSPTGRTLCLQELAPEIAARIAEAERIAAEAEAEAAAYAEHAAAIQAEHDLKQQEEHQVSDFILRSSS